MGPGSPGCGVTSSPGSGTFTIDVGGVKREYNVKVPAGYDPNKPHRMTFAWHGLTGTAVQIQQFGYYQLESMAGGSAIFAAGQGLDDAGGTNYGWADTGGRDVAFVRALYERLRGQYCLDEKRVFSVGMSYGGIFSNRLGCAMGNVFRAIAPQSGSGPGGYGPTAPQCVGQVAAWISHGNQDMVVPLSSGQGSRDHWVKANHCMTTTTPVEPTGCVAYQGCDNGFPVHWCEFAGGHTIPNWAAKGVWTFFSQF